MPPERPPKVFISYSHDSPAHMARALELADRLRASGVDAMIDQYVHDPEDGWQFWTESQIRDAGFVLVICTETYLKRAERREEPGIGHGAIWEISVAYVLLYNKGMKNKKFIPVVFLKADRTYIPVPLQSYTNYCISADQGFLELYRLLTSQPLITMPELGTIEGLPPLQRPKKSKPARLWNVPHTRNDAFTGREELISGLRDDLKQRGKQALSGLGGVGKTQIAVEYAYRHREDYTAVLWSFADTEQSVRAGFGAMAALLDLPEKDAAEQATVTDTVRHWLELNQGWLLVLDNADDPAMVKQFLPQQGKGHFLLTSRAHAFDVLGIFSPREVNVLTPDEAREFLLRRTGKDTSAKSSEADALAKELGYLPLALEQAAAYVTATGAKFETYLASLKKQRTKLLAKQGPVLGNDAKEQQKRTVATTWALNFADVEKNSPASAELLRLSAFLAPDAIPLELLEKGGKDLPDGLAEKLAGAGDDPLALDELLSPLLRYSLVRRNEETRSYSIHPMVQEVLREGLTEQERRGWAERAVRAVSAAFPDPEFENWPKCDRFLPHALICAEVIDWYRLEFAAAPKLLNQAAYYLKYRAEYMQAEPLYRLALKIREKAMGPDHQHTAVSLNNLSELYRAQGRNEEAEPLCRRALEIRERALGAEHAGTAVSLNNLGRLLEDQGKYAEVEPLYQRALQIFEKALGPEHANAATGLNNLAGLYCIQGRYEDAEPLQRRSLEIRERALGPNHPETASSLNNLARILAEQEKRTEAEPLYRRALEILEKALVPEHPNTILVRNNLILFYREQSRNAEAEALEKSTRTKKEAE